MADMSNDVKGLTTAIDGLLKKINQLHTAVNTLGGDATKQFKAVNGVVSDTGGARNIGFGSIRSFMQGSLAGFSNPTATSMGATGMSSGAIASLGGSAIIGGVTGAAQVAMAPFSLAYGATMDTSGIINRAGSYYQAALRAPGTSRAGLERATFSALNGGMTGVGSDAQVANILANAGYVPGSQDYLNAVRQVGGAANYLGMSNSNAAAAIAGLQSGTTGATMYQYGISTIDSKGNSLSVGNIAQQMYSRLIKPGATAAQIQGSAKNGFLNSALAGMGVTSPDQQQMITQAFIDIASGKNPDLASAKAFAGNKNPFSAAYQINASQTGLQMAGENNAISGMQGAADTVTAFNNVMKDTIVSMQKYKSYLDTLSGTNAGKGIKSGLSGLLGGLKKVAGGVLLGAGVLSSEAGIGIPMAAAGAALLAGPSGGGTPGFGGSFGGSGPKGGGTPGGPVSAAYGATDSSGIWSSTGGIHLGTDYDVSVGTPVYAVMDGVVSSNTLSTDYGQAVQIDHSNGYSTVYAHLSNKEVSPGKPVFKGQEIGKSGKSGNTTGPSLHYEVRKGANNPVDPAQLIGAGSPLGGTSGSAIAGGYAPGNPSLSGGKPNNTNTGTKAQQAWAKSFLTSLGAPTTASNMTAMTTWAAYEGGLNHNNPLNTTYSTSDATVWNSVGVKTYPSLQEGTQATISTLTGKDAAARGYTSIVDALKKGTTPTSDILQLVNKSSWGSHIGGGTPGYGAYVPTANSYYGIRNNNAATTQTLPSHNVTINLTIGQASDSEAVAFAKRVQAVLEGKAAITTIGSN